MPQKKNKALIPFIIFAIVLVVSIGGLILANNLRQAQINNPPAYANQDEVPRITAKEAYSAVMTGDAVLLDTRSADAFASQHAAGAINVPIGEFESRLGELDPDTWYLTYCTWPNEATSARAAFIMLNNGFAKANPILGGLEAWVQSRYPVEPLD